MALERFTRLQRGTHLIRSFIAGLIAFLREKRLNVELAMSLSRGSVILAGLYYQCHITLDNNRTTCAER